MSGIDPEPLVEPVIALMREAAELEVLPWFRKLAAEDVEQKTGPTDLVTAADRNAEAWLTPRLEALLSGSYVLGEEAVSERPGDMAYLQADDPLWIIDPVDGTRNFVAGHDNFGMIVALAVAGQVVAGWIYLPIRQSLTVALQGGGTERRDADPALSPKREQSPGDLPDCSLNVRFLPEHWPAALESLNGRRFRAVPETCSAFEYALLARGERDFAIYNRLMPWDHAAGTLIVTEAGGASRNIETGVPYAPRTLKGPQLIARDVDEWGEMASAVLAVLKA